MYTQERETTKRKVYRLYPHQVAAIKQTAKDNGQCSDSAALRFIIDDWARRIAAESGLVLRQIQGAAK